MLWLQGRCHAQADTLALGCVERGIKSALWWTADHLVWWKLAHFIGICTLPFTWLAPVFWYSLAQATAAAALLWHMASSILRWALSLWLDGCSEWASKHFLFFCSSPAYMHSSQVTPRILHYGDACGVSILFSHPAIRLQKHFHSGLHLISTFRILLTCGVCIPVWSKIRAQSPKLLKERL